MLPVSSVLHPEFLLPSTDAQDYMTCYFQTHPKTERKRVCVCSSRSLRSSDRVNNYQHCLSKYHQHLSANLAQQNVSGRAFECGKENFKNITELVLNHFCWICISQIFLFPPTNTHLHIRTLCISVLVLNIYATYCTHRIQSARLFFADKYYICLLAQNTNICRILLKP